MRFRSDEAVPAARVVQRLLVGQEPFGTEPVISKQERPEEERIAVLHADRETGLPMPRGRDACRVLLIREAEQIQTFIAKRWSYESTRLWLLDRDGAAFDLGGKAGRFPGSGTTVVHNSKPNRDKIY